MCQASDTVHIDLIIKNDEPWALEAKGELDGEPIRIVVAVHNPESIQQCLVELGRLLDRQRLVWDFQ